MAKLFKSFEDYFRVQILIKPLNKATSETVTKYK
jgi:hypothetical protein